MHKRQHHEKDNIKILYATSCEMVRPKHVSEAHVMCFKWRFQHIVVFLYCCKAEWIFLEKGVAKWSKFGWLGGRAGSFVEGLWLKGELAPGKD